MECHQSNRCWVIWWRLGDYERRVDKTEQRKLEALCKPPFETIHTMYPAWSCDHGQSTKIRTQHKTGQFLSKELQINQRITQDSRPSRRIQNLVNAGCSRRCSVVGTPMSSTIPEFESPSPPMDALPVNIAFHRSARSKILSGWTTMTKFPSHKLNLTTNPNRRWCRTRCEYLRSPSEPESMFLSLPTQPTPRMEVNPYVHQSISELSRLCKRPLYTLSALRFVNGVFSQIG